MFYLLVSVTIFSFHYLRIIAFGASLVTQLMKNLPAMQETCVRTLGWEDPLEKGMATYSSAPALPLPRSARPAL